MLTGIQLRHMKLYIICIKSCRYLIAFVSIFKQNITVNSHDDRNYIHFCCRPIIIHNYKITFLFLCWGTREVIK